MRANLFLTFAPFNFLKNPINLQNLLSLSIKNIIARINAPKRQIFLFDIPVHQTQCYPPLSRPASAIQKRSGMRRKYLDPVG